MSYKKIIPYINAENELPLTVIQLAKKYEDNGADELFIYNYSKDEESREELLLTAKQISREVDIPFAIGIYVKRFEDVKKAIYTGATFVVVKQELLEEESGLKEAIERFGTNKVIMEVDSASKLYNTENMAHYKDLGVYAILLKHVFLTDKYKKIIQNSVLPIMIRDSLVRNDLADLMLFDTVFGVSTNAFEHKDIMKVKMALKLENIKVNIFESALKFSDFKLNSHGLIPVVTQDYKTNEVLMVAYMNEAAFQETLDSGKMTYWSRSRNELWKKGDTSSHYQYVKSLMIDCDNDTILAKVRQVGAACHTGNRSCFYTELVKKEFDDTNPLTVFNDVYDVIMNRKKNPKEGSYTNYLFDKGIDKILKKCGEEATEIIIAAKNPDAEELKYEIADFLYHMMVLMAECDLDWNDVVKELAHRR